MYTLSAEKGERREKRTKKRANMILVMSILVLPMIMVGLPVKELSPLPSPVEASSYPAGNFRVGFVRMTLNHKKVLFIGAKPVPKAKVEVFDPPTAGHTDHLGRVCFQIHIYIRDNTYRYNALVKGEARVYERLTSPPYTGKLVGKRPFYNLTEGKQTLDYYLEVATDKLDIDETQEYLVEIYAHFTVFRLLEPDAAWPDDDFGYVTVESRAHPAYQQIVSISEPLPGGRYVIGTTGEVNGYIYADPAAGQPVSDTRVCIHLATERGFGSQTHYNRTDSSGYFSQTFVITDPLANGTIFISVYDEAKDAGYIADSDGDTVAITAKHPPGCKTFGLFAVPYWHTVTRGHLIRYLVAVTSINYEGKASLSISDLPEGTTGLFECNSMLIGSNETAGVTLTICTTHTTPFGWHPFNISATDGTLTRDLTCPLMVRPTDRVSHKLSPAGRPHVDQIWWEIIIDPSARLTALLQHEVDAGRVWLDEDVAKLIGAGFTIEREEGTGFWAFTGPYGTQPGAIGIVNMTGVGPLSSVNRVGKTLGQADRIEGGKNVVRWLLSDFIYTTLNPLTAHEESAWQVLSLITEDLITYYPYTLDYMWWAAEAEPTTELWIGPGRSQIGGNEVYDATFSGTHYDGIPVADVTEADLVGDDQLGLVTTWTLRDDLYWHDSNPGADMVFGTGDDGVLHPVTAEDLRFGLDLLKYQQNEVHFESWYFIHCVDVVDSYTLKIFEEQRDILAFERHGTGLLTPKHIWEPFIQPTIIVDACECTLPDGSTTSGNTWTGYVNHHEDWYGWEEAYRDWAGEGTDNDCPIHPGYDLTYLIGFGPFHYHYGGWDPGVSAHVEANYAYFTGPVCPGDVDFDQMTEIIDINYILSSFGSYGDPKYDVRADICYPAQKVDLDEVYAVLFTHFGHWWGPGPVPVGFVECPG